MEYREGISGGVMETAPAQAQDFGLRDKWFVFISLALGFLLFDFILFEGFGISLPAYMALFYAAVFWYFSGKPGGIRREGLWLLIPIALLSACFALYDNLALSMLNFLLLVVLVILQLATMSGNRLYKSFSLGLLIDLFHAGVALPAVNVPAPFKALRSGRKAAGKPGAGPIFIGIALSVPLLAVVLALLSSADFVFERSLSGLIEFLRRNVMEYLLKLFFGAAAAIPLFGLMSALRHNRTIGGMKRRIDFSRVCFIDAGIANTVLVLLNAVYLVFVAVQFGYLFNAFSSILPADFTYAEYARRGFFELMGVVCVNLCVLAVSYLFSRRGGTKGAAFLKAMETALVALTLLLIASASAKMVMYVNAYGLTLLRVYVSWFLLFCAVAFAALGVKLHVKRFAFTRFCAAAFVLMYLGLNFLNVDALIPRYNIGRYESGAVRTLDVGSFGGLSDSMVPYAATLLDAADRDIAAGARAVLEDRAGILNDNRWQTFTLDRRNAQAALSARGIKTNEGSGRR